MIFNQYVNYNIINGNGYVKLAELIKGFPLFPKQDGLVINYPYVLLNNQKFHQQNLILQINQDQF